MEKTYDMLSVVDSIINFSEEKKKDNGEDCENHSINRKAALISVFDGCGGAGAQVCSKFNINKTEAYIASRVVADSFQEWFDAVDDAKKLDEKNLKNEIIKGLKACDRIIGEKSQLMGMMKKHFPTTAAAAVCYIEDRSLIRADLYWAGDSRVYLLNEDGLAQLTEDDLGGIDAMQNLSDDGVMTNMINLTTDFHINMGSIIIDKPCILFAATDGCFGYLSTPMEFEFLMLKCLMDSHNVSEYESNLINKIGKIASDDYSISGVILGFGNFQNIKKRLVKRASDLYGQTISKIDSLSYSEKKSIWDIYKNNYYRLLNRQEEN